MTDEKMPSGPAESNVSDFSYGYNMLALCPLVHVGKCILSRIAGDYIDVPGCVYVHSRADAAIKDVLGDLGPISVLLWASASPFIHAVACTESVLFQNGL